MKLLIVIPTCKNDAARAEQLIDMTFHLNGRKAQGHCLLVFAPDLHAEMKAKLKLSASIAFESVEEHSVAEIITMTKHEQCMEMLNSAAQHIYSNFTWPWLWLEPDCVPLKKGWMDTIENAYHNQPRKFLGLKMASNGVTFLMRCCVYPYDAFLLFAQARELNVTLYEYIVNRSPNCRLFQWLAINDIADASKVREDAVIAHHDKKGLLVDWVLGQSASAPKEVDDAPKEAARPTRTRARKSEPILEPIV